MFIIANLLFAIGCVFLMPGIYKTERAKFRADDLGAWFCVVGSFGLVFAAYWNAICLGQEFGQLGYVLGGGTRTPTDVIATGRIESRDLQAKTDYTCFAMLRIALALTQVGGVLFTAGSFLFRPAFEQGSCLSNDTKVCQDISKFG